MDSVVKYWCKFKRTLKYSSDEDYFSPSFRITPVGRRELFFAQNKVVHFV